METFEIEASIRVLAMIGKGWAGAHRAPVEPFVEHFHAPQPPLR